MDLELNLLDYWRMLVKRWKLIAILVVISVLSTGLYSYLVIKPVYSATATILVQNQQMNESVVYNDLLANQKLIKTYSEIIKSRQVAEGVIERLSLNTSYEALIGKVKIVSVADSLVTRITVSDNNPEQAVAIANGFAYSFTNNLIKIMKVDNASVLDYAALPAKPVPTSPKPVQNMIVAGMAGAIAGVMLVFLLEFLDKTVKNESEIEELLGVPVLGVIANFDIETNSKSRKARKGKGLKGGVSHEG